MCLRREIVWYAAHHHPIYPTFHSIKYKSVVFGLTLPRLSFPTYFSSLYPSILPPTQLASSDGLLDQSCLGRADAGFLLAFFFLFSFLCTLNRQALSTCRLLSRWRVAHCHKLGYDTLFGQ